jgi:MFS family permease
VLGVQWHPEFGWEGNELSQAIFKAFIVAASAGRGGIVTEGGLSQQGKVTVALLSTAHFVTDSYSSFLIPLLPLLTLRLHLTPTQAGLLIPTMMITTSLMQPVYGMISDRYLKRSMAVFGPLVAAIFFSLIGLADTLPLLVTCIVIGGIGIGSFHPQSAALVSASSLNRRGSTMSIFLIGGDCWCRSRASTDHVDCRNSWT